MVFIGIIIGVVIMIVVMYLVLWDEWFGLGDDEMGVCVAFVVCFDVGT